LGKLGGKGVVPGERGGSLASGSGFEPPESVRLPRGDELEKGIGKDLFTSSRRGMLVV